MKIRESRNKEKARKDLFSSESAASTVIAAVLLLSIIFTIFAVVKIAYVPEWKTDAEQSHMSEVQRDMTELKSTVDTIAFFTVSSPSYSAHPHPVTVPFSMGGGEIPILEPSKSSGTLSVNTEPCNMNITLTYYSNTSTFERPLDCGGITYYSNNRQYVDQIFRYENGALILKQSERSLMKLDPSFIITRDNDNYNISIQAIDITGRSDTISSDTDTSLKLNGTTVKPVYDSSSDENDIKSFSCMITTKYPEAWESYLSKVAKEAGLENPKDYTLYNTSDKVYFTFTGSKNLENLYISESVIGAEIGVGSDFNHISYITADNGEVPPIAKPIIGDSPLSVQFTGPSENAISWNWDFGDGNTSTEQNPEHTYFTAENYNVSLKVSNANYTNSKYVTITVLQPKVPVAKFSNHITTGYSPLVVKFTDLSENNATAWNWDFGDGTTSTDRNPRHTYSSIGDHTVTLTVSNAAGKNTDIKSNHIHVKAMPESTKPIANFSVSPSSGYVPLTVMFADQSTGWPTSCEWNFEDGTHSETQNNEYNYTYNKAGNYNVSLKVTNANGTDSKFTTINVLKSTPEITWSKPDDIIYGTSLNSTQLDASASVDGTYTYTPASGTVLRACLKIQPDLTIGIGLHI